METAFKAASTSEDYLTFIQSTLDEEYRTAEHELEDKKIPETAYSRQPQYFPQSDVAFGRQDALARIAYQKSLTTAAAGAETQLRIEQLTKLAKLYDSALQPEYRFGENIDSLTSASALYFARFSKVFPVAMPELSGSNKYPPSFFALQAGSLETNNSEVLPSSYRDHWNTLREEGQTLVGTEADSS